MKNYKSAILFNDPFNCPFCSSNLTVSAVVTKYGTINTRNGEFMIDEELPLDEVEAVCAFCNKTYSISTLTRGDDTDILTIDRDSAIKYYKERFDIDLN